MGRNRTGAYTVYESFRIELTYLLKRGYIKKNSTSHFTLNWKDQRGNQTGSICCKSSYLNLPQEQYLELYYVITKRDGEKIDNCYKVYLTKINSNLGKGEIVYFLCPQTGKKCRILYIAYNSTIFKSRQAYSHRLYYDCQQSSKLNIYNDNYWRLDQRISQIGKQAYYGKRAYLGVLTKTAMRYNRLLLKQDRMDQLRWSAGVPQSLRAQMKNGRLEI